MLRKPTIKDFRIIGYYCGRLTVGLGWLMLIPLSIAIIYTEITPALIFITSIATCFIAGYSLTYFLYNREDLKFMHSLVVVPLAWLLAALLGAQPLYLSGHFASFLDAYFESMSALATTGLSLAADLDHMPASINFWRHQMMFIGGQGIVVIALSVLQKTAGGVFGLYSGEAREEKILPNVVSTARFIWTVSLTYFTIGTLILWSILLYEGMHVGRALIQAASLFMAAFDTGGFAPHAQNILYYHSGLVEFGLIFLMIVGCVNFGLHFILWRGYIKELYRNAEIIMLTGTIFLTFFIASFAIAHTSTYVGTSAFFSKTFFQLISAHTGTGFMTVYSPQLLNEWAPMALVTLIVAMALGGSVSSTSGGVKALRVAIVLKLLKIEILRLVEPPSAVIVTKYHHIKDVILTETMTRNVLLIVISYIVTFMVGTLFAMFFDYGFTEALFESVSAAANVGLSAGITSPDMPDLLKAVYIFEMWIGRLEFLSIFAIIGIIWALLKGR